MKKLFQLFKKNEVLSFTLIKYSVHVINFSRVILAAKILGPFYFGIWGFLNLCIQYLSHSLLGIQYSLNLELSTSDQSDKSYVHRLTSSALFITTVISVVLLTGGVWMYWFQPNLFERYRLSHYSLYIVAIVSLLNFQQVLFNIFRVYGKFFKIGFAELLVSLAVLVALFVAEEENLIQILFFSWIGSLIISITIFFFNSPIPLRIKKYADETKTLFKVGFPLLIYNLSYYLIIISSTTVLSIFYPVEVMGYYTLSNSISNAILLGINSIVWAFFPSFLAQMKEGIPSEQAVRVIEKINRIYLAAIFIIFIAFLILAPAIYFFLNQYAASEPTLNILFVTQIILASNFAANTYTMARKKYLHLAWLSFISVIVVSVFSVIFASFKLHYNWIAFSTVLGAVAFSVTTRLYLKKQIPEIIAPLIRFSFTRLSLAIVLCGNLLFPEYLLYFNFIGVLVYIIANRNQLKEVYKEVWQKLVAR